MPDIVYLEGHDIDRKIQLGLTIPDSKTVYHYLKQKLPDGSLRGGRDTRTLRNIRMEEESFLILEFGAFQPERRLRYRPEIYYKIRMEIPMQYHEFILDDKLFLPDGFELINNLITPGEEQIILVGYAKDDTGKYLKVERIGTMLYYYFKGGKLIGVDAAFFTFDKRYKSGCLLDVSTDSHDYGEIFQRSFMDHTGLLSPSLLFGWTDIKSGGLFIPLNSPVDEKAAIDEIVDILFRKLMDDWRSTVRLMEYS